VGDKEDEAESLNHSGMLALVDKEGNVRCRFDKMECLSCIFWFELQDAEGKNAKLDGKFQPDRKLLIEDIKKLLEE
jgi:protein SCO1/2